MNLDVHTRHFAATPGHDAKDERQVEIDRILDKLKEIIERTIEQQGVAPWVERNNSRKPQVNFYADADLLVVVGTPDELETARKIVNALPGETGQSYRRAVGGEGGHPPTVGTKPE